MKPDQTNPEAPTGLRRTWRASRLLSEGARLGRKSNAMAVRAGRLTAEATTLAEQIQGREPTPKEARRMADLMGDVAHIQAEFARMVARHDIIAAELTSLGVPSQDFATYCAERS